MLSVVELPDKLKIMRLEEIPKVGSNFECENKSYIITQVRYTNRPEHFWFMSGYYFIKIKVVPTESRENQYGR
jgi:hypothetical protein